MSCEDENIDWAQSTSHIKITGYGISTWEDVFRSCLLVTSICRGMLLYLPTSSVKFEDLIRSLSDYYKLTAYFQSSEVSTYLFSASLVVIWKFECCVVYDQRFCHRISSGQAAEIRCSNNLLTWLISPDSSSVMRSFNPTFFITYF